MDYLDDLDNSAIQALTQLGGAIDSNIPSAQTPNQLTSSASRPPQRRIPPTYLIRLENPLSTPRDVANILRLSRLPPLETGTGESGTASFCRLSHSDVQALDIWTATYCPGKRFTKIRVAMAHKDENWRDLPFLGRDCTLPQYQPSMLSLPLPQYQPSRLSLLDVEAEFPVLYFFYGTLTSRKVLSRLFDLPARTPIRLYAATLLDGRLRTWAGKYKALVDSPGDMVDGYVFLDVKNAEREEALRRYEGDCYEVVRANVKEIKRMVRVFRFCGDGAELDG